MGIESSNKDKMDTTPESKRKINIGKDKESPTDKLNVIVSHIREGMEGKGTQRSMEEEKRTEKEIVEAAKIPKKDKKQNVVDTQKPMGVITRRAASKQNSL